jgi:hypothetical protein
VLFFIQTPWKLKKAIAKQAFNNVFCGVCLVRMGIANLLE